MQINKDTCSVMFIPQFVAKTLQRDSMGFLPLLFSDEIIKKLSINYLAYLFCLDKQISEKLNVEAITAYQNDTYAMYRNIANTETYALELEALRNAGKDVNDKETFIIYDTQSKLVCVVVKDNFDFNNQEHLLAVTKEVLKHWYMYEKPEMVARTPLYRQYLKLLCN